MRGEAVRGGEGEEEEVRRERGWGGTARSLKMPFYSGLSDL